MERERERGKDVCLGSYLLVSPLSPQRAFASVRSDERNIKKREKDQDSCPALSLSSGSHTSFRLLSG